ncbi:MAG: rRNA maturation RNase YbeY [Thermodesulfovibrionales bacterium]|nr:rRNA maturation RNase YbeY [Thermodesulfovibrionales bacterium]
MKVLIQNRQKTAKTNQQKIKRDSEALLRLLGLKDAELSILLIDDRRMRGLNSKYRGIDRVTDVLSFPQNNRNMLRVTRYALQPLILGDVVINLQAAKRQAPEHGMAFAEEVRWLLVHGVLHLIGYNHERSKYAERKMREKEKELLKYLLKSS